MKDLDTIIYDTLDELYPSNEMGCAGCRIMDGCRNLSCPNMKLFLARKIAKQIKETRPE